MILVDTSFWKEFLKGTNSPERHALHMLIEEEEDISITETILSEILQWIRKDYLINFNLCKSSSFHPISEIRPFNSFVP